MGPRVLSLGQGMALVASLADPTLTMYAFLTGGVVAVVAVIAVAFTRPDIEVKHGKGFYRIDYSRKGRRKAKAAAK